MVFEALATRHASGSVLQAAQDISSILAGEKTKKHAQLGDANMRAAMALAINPNLALAASRKLRTGNQAGTNQLLSSALPGSKFTPDM
mmetsp:Transcript_26204/g.62568  ORF Transcript_26204/g.62568 Transcript_26204/m.62568 type:complete len:88 (+) Transcript_26204:42-305(+)